MASVFKRRLKDGEYWILKVRLKDGTWKQYNSQINIDIPRSRQKALAAANRIQGVIDAGGDPFRGRITQGIPLSEAREDFLNHCRRLWSASTFARYSQTTQLFCEIGGSEVVEQVDAQTIERFVSALQQRGVVSAQGVRLREIAVPSINIHLRNLRAWFRWLKEFKQIDDERWRVPRIRQGRVPEQGYADYYTPEEAERLLKSAQEAYYFIGHLGRRRHDPRPEPILPLLLLALDTGMRMNEMLRLDWSMIDRERGVIFLSGSNTKTKKPRVVLVSDFVLKLLSRFRSEGEIFRDWRARGASDVYYQVQKSANLKRLKFHNLRDTYIQNQLFEGVRPEVVAAQCGNSPSVIFQHYVYIGLEEMRRGFRGQKRGEYVTALSRGSGFGEKRGAKKKYIDKLQYLDNSF